MRLGVLIIVSLLAGLGILGVLIVVSLLAGLGMIPIALMIMEAVGVQDLGLNGPQSIAIVVVSAAAFFAALRKLPHDGRVRRLAAQLAQLAISGFALVGVGVVLLMLSAVVHPAGLARQVGSGQEIVIATVVWFGIFVAVRESLFRRRSVD